MGLWDCFTKPLGLEAIPKYKFISAVLQKYILEKILGRRLLTKGRLYK